MAKRGGTHKFARKSHSGSKEQVGYPMRKSGRK